MECSSVDVMRYSCIGALAQKIDPPRPHINSTEKLAEQSQEDSLEHIIPRIPILGPGDTVINVYVCTPLQSSMLTQTLGSDGRLYSHHHAVRLAHNIDLTRLRKAWEWLKTRTEILEPRSTFPNRFIRGWQQCIRRVPRIGQNATSEPQCLTR